MKTFLDQPEIIDILQDFLHRHKSYTLANTEEVDEEVANQKTRLYKFKCWLIWGHLVKKGKTTCSRCGKVITNKT